MEVFGRLDVLVNNAGILTFASIADMPLADFRRVLEVNAVGCWLGMKAVIGPMKAAGGGSIVNISSIEGFTGAAGLSAYSASKFAVRGMTKVAAHELGQFGIRVNSVHPGGVLTRMVLDSGGRPRSDGEAFIKAMPLARFAEPVEISRLVAYLASDESSYSTGSEFIADGGILCRARATDRSHWRQLRRAEPGSFGIKILRRSAEWMSADAGRPGGHRDRGGKRARPGGVAGAGPGRGAAGAQRPAGRRGAGGGGGDQRGRRPGGGGRGGCRGVGDRARSWWRRRSSGTGGWTSWSTTPGCCATG